MNFTNLLNVSKYLNKKVCEQIGFFSQGKYSISWLNETNPNTKNLRVNLIDSGLFGTSFFAKTRPIGGINLNIDKPNKIVDISWWFVNDNDFIQMVGSEVYGSALDHEEAEELKSILFNYANTVGKEADCTMLKRDVHYNMKEYNSTIKNFGFKITGEKALDNTSWLVTTKQIVY